MKKGGLFWMKEGKHLRKPCWTGDEVVDGMLRLWDRSLKKLRKIWLQSRNRCSNQGYEGVKKEARRIVHEKTCWNTLQRINQHFRRKWNGWETNKLQNECKQGTYMEECGKAKIKCAGDWNSTSELCSMWEKRGALWSMPGLCYSRRKFSSMFPMKIHFVKSQLKTPINIKTS